MQVHACMQRHVQPAEPAFQGTQANRVPESADVLTCTIASEWPAARAASISRFQLGSVLCMLLQSHNQTPELLHRCKRTGIVSRERCPNG